MGLNHDLKGSMRPHGRIVLLVLLVGTWVFLPVIPSYAQIALENEVEEEDILLFGREDELVYGADDWKKNRDAWLERQKVRKARIKELGLDERYETAYLYDNTRYLLYTEKDFDTVETQLASNFATANEPLKAHRYHGLIASMGNFYYGEDPEVLLSVLDAWVKAKPDSHYARLVRGKYYTDYAWYFRGTGYAHTVSGRSWEQFGRYLEASKNDLDMAHELNPKDPEASVGLITIAGGGGGLSMREYYERAISINPLHYGARRKVLHFLRPRWGGSIEAMEAFVEESETAAKDFPLLRMLSRTASHYIYYAEAISEEEWDTIRNDPKWLDVIVAQLKQNPDDVHLMNSAASYAYKSKQYKTSMEYYVKIGDRFPAGGMTSNVISYNKNRALAVSQGALWIGGDRQMALAKEALELNPNGANTNFIYGVLLVEGHGDAGGRPYLERAVEINSKSVRAMAILASLSLKEKRYAEALDYAERVLAGKHPESIERKMKTVIRASKREL